MISSRNGQAGAAPAAAREPEAAGVSGHGRRKQPQDTAQGCRALAAADLASAGALDEGWPRARMENSAAAWTTRADLLHRLETGIEAARRRADAGLARSGR
ncbi:MAG TPA: hypothetical protein VFW19_07095 [Allosphingosinicella sp.]|nr:hypothetical protein [Allosphingosinicella sp.]